MTTEYESYSGTRNDFIGVQALKWRAQTFTVGATPHTVTSVKLYLCKYNSPTGLTTISIRATDGNGLPTGSDLGGSTGTKDSSTLTSYSTFTQYEITLSAAVTLAANTKYAIAIRDPSDSGSNEVEIGVIDDGYTGGQVCISVDGGVTWSVDSPSTDALFEVWGNPSAQAWTQTRIQAVSVLSSLLKGLGPGAKAQLISVIQSRLSYPRLVRTQPVSILPLVIMAPVTVKVQAIVAIPSILARSVSKPLLLPISILDSSYKQVSSLRIHTITVAEILQKGSLKQLLQALTTHSLFTEQAEYNREPVQSISVIHYVIKDSAKSNIQRVIPATLSKADVLKALSQPISIFTIPIRLPISWTFSLLQPLAISDTLVKTAQFSRSPSQPVSISSLVAMNPSAFRTQLISVIPTPVSLMTLVREYTQPISIGALGAKEITKSGLQQVSVSPLTLKQPWKIQIQPLLVSPSLTSQAGFLRLSIQPITVVTIPTRVLALIRSFTQPVSVDSSLIMARGLLVVLTQLVTVSSLLTKAGGKTMIESLIVQIPSLVYVAEWGSYVLIIESSGEEAIGTYIG